MNWIMRKKIYQPMDFVCSVLLNILNVTILAVVLDLLFRLNRINGTDWYQTAVTNYTETDVFYKEKSNVLLYTMAVVALVILVYSVYTMWMFWGQQKKRLDTQLGVFMTEGYTKFRLWVLLCGEALLDELIAVAVSIGCYRLYLMLGSKNEMWLSLYRLSESENLMWQVLLIAVTLYALAVLVFHHLWIAKAEKAGAAVLLKGR